MQLTTLTKIFTIPAASIAVTMPLVLTSCNKNNKDESVTIDWNTTYSGTQLPSTEGPLTAAQATEKYFTAISSDKNILLNDLKMELQRKRKQDGIDQSSLTGNIKYTLTDLEINKDDKTLSFNYSMTKNIYYSIDSGWRKHEYSYNNSISVKNVKFKAEIYSTYFNYDWVLSFDSTTDWSKAKVSGKLNGYHKVNDKTQDDTFNNIPFTCSNSSDWNKYASYAMPIIPCWYFQNIASK